MVGFQGTPLLIIRHETLHNTCNALIDQYYYTILYYTITIIIPTLLIDKTVWHYNNTFIGIILITIVETLCQ